MTFDAITKADGDLMTLARSKKTRVAKVTEV